MARPAGKVLLSTQTEDSLVDILDCSGLWTVLYKNKPFKVRKKYYIWKGETQKTNQTTYSSAAPARNLANKLNTLFGTNDFTVQKIL